ncbi:adenosine-specific kinase [Rhodococcus sp. 2H158]
MELQIVAVDKPDDMNVVVGPAVKTVEDLHEALVGVSPTSGSGWHFVKPRGLASCAVRATTANPVEIIVADKELGRGIAGVIDGRAPAGVESSSDVADRKAMLRTIGCKL